MKNRPIREYINMNNFSKLDLSRDQKTSFSHLKNSRRSWFKGTRLFVLGLLLFSIFSFNACATDACYSYFNELKRVCRLDGSKEGAKLDTYLEKPFRPCQIEICRRASTSDIKCSDPETHIPGGFDGSFLSCE